MPELRFNLLTDALIGVEAPDGARLCVSLPQLLERLGKGEELEFLRMQAHQSHAWHAFLVQLASIVLHRAGLEKVAQGAGFWREQLRGLAGGDEGFCLVVSDLAKPAFLQPPVPEKSLAVLKNQVRFPDDLDLLVTAKHHDVKMHRIQKPTPEHWMYTLVSLQTMEGFMGRGNYGISRMNGGFASRPALSCAPGLGHASRFVRDVHACLDAREAIADKLSYAARDGHALLWLLPWDGARPLHVPSLDPFYIEICRRLRLVLDGETIVAHRGNSSAARIDTGASQGNTGDPWTPIAHKDGRALTVDGTGFSYKRMQELLSPGEWEGGAALRLREEDGPEPLVLAEVLVRGQGETQGYHERVLPIPKKAKGFFASPEGREKIGRIAKRWVERVAEVRLRVLRPALLVLIQADPEKLKLDDGRMDGWVSQLDREVDAIFFERLFANLERDPGEADREFLRDALEIAKGILERAIDAVSLPSERRYRAIARAEGLFAGASRKAFPDLFMKEGDEDDERKHAHA